MLVIKQVLGDVTNGQSVTLVLGDSPKSNTVVGNLVLPATTLKRLLRKAEEQTKKRK